MVPLLRLVLTACLVAVCATGCGGRTQTMHALGSAARLKSLLRDRGIPLGRGATPKGTSLPVALRAFAEFADIPIAAGELERDPMSDGDLYEFGVFDFRSAWGNTLILSFVRQYALTDGDLQQVHLEAHFRAAALPAILRRTRATTCDGRDCVYRCAFGGAGDLLGERCSVRAGRPGRGRSLHSASLWSFDTGKPGTSAARHTWLSLVEASPPFRYLSTHRNLLLGYEVWQDSAE